MAATVVMTTSDAIRPYHNNNNNNNNNDMYVSNYNVSQYRGGCRPAASSILHHYADCRLMGRARSNSDTSIPNLSSTRWLSSARGPQQSTSKPYPSLPTSGIDTLSCTNQLPPLSSTIANIRTVSSPSRAAGGAFCGHARQAFYNLRCGCLFSFIPDEILLFNVFTFFDHQLLSSISAVCKR
jgi:hypothetical protein